MKKKLSTEVVAVSTQGIAIPKTADDVPATIEQLKKVLKALTGDEEKEVSLDVSFGGQKVKDVTKVSQLLEMSSRLHAKCEAYEQEKVRYGLVEMNLKPWSEEGLTIDAIEKVFNKAIKVLINKVQIDNIQAAIDELSKHLSSQDRLAATLEKVMGKAGQAIE